MTSILVVAERYWPDGGGGELATHLVIDALKKRFDVTVVTGTENPFRVSAIEHVHEPLLSRQGNPVIESKVGRIPCRVEYGVDGLLIDSSQILRHRLRRWRN